MFIFTNIGRCGSITVDLDSNRIFWINYDRKSIQSAGLNGKFSIVVRVYNGWELFTLDSDSMSPQVFTMFLIF